MKEVRELLSSRMGPASVSLDMAIGRPDYSSQEVAGALAMVAPGLGRELLEACWWPESAVAGRERLRDEIIDLVGPELRRQHDALSEARTRLGIANACITWAGSVTAAQRAARDAAARELEYCKDVSWPITTLESLPTLASAVIKELACKSKCRTCDGHGRRQAGKTLLVCPECHGEGVGASSDRKRAAAIGRDESTYRAKWRRVYEWMFDRMDEAERSAAVALGRALGIRESRTRD